MSRVDEKIKRLPLNVPILFLPASAVYRQKKHLKMRIMPGRWSRFDGAATKGHRRVWITGVSLSTPAIWDCFIASVSCKPYLLHVKDACSRQTNEAVISAYTGREIYRLSLAHWNVSDWFCYREHVVCCTMIVWESMPALFSLRPGASAETCPANRGSSSEVIVQ
jgi:hypothetical protein